MTGLELHGAEVITPSDIIDSMRSYAVDGGAINAGVYIDAMGRCEPPMSMGELKELRGLALTGVISNRFDGQLRMTNPTQREFGEVVVACGLAIEDLNT